MNFRLLALQDMDKKGLLTALRGMEHKLVTCHIVGADCAVQATYGALRGNDIAAEGVRKPYVFELIFVLEGLTDQFGKDKAIEAVARYGKSLGFGYDEMTAVRKIGAWPVQSIKSLATIFCKFQSLQTLDGQKIAKRQSRKIMSGSIIEVPKILLKQVSKVDNEYFQEKAILVIEKQISLQFLVDEFFKIPKRQLIVACIIEISGFKAFESLKIMFPGKFTEDILDKYVGAIIGEKENDVGAALKDYCQKVFEDKDNEPKAEFFELNRYSELDLGSSIWEDYDLLIVSCVGMSNENLLHLLSLKRLNNKMNILIQFDNQREATNSFNEVLKAPGLLEPKLIFFKLDQEVVAGFCENIKLGILLTGTVLKPPIFALTGDLAQLVSKLGGSKVAFVFEGQCKLVNLHTVHSCDYFGNQECLDIFKKNLGIVSAVDRRVDKITPVEVEAGPSGISNSTMIDPTKLMEVDMSLDISEIPRTSSGARVVMVEEDDDLAETKVGKIYKKSISSVFDEEEVSIIDEIMSKQKQEVEKLAERIKGRKSKTIAKMAELTGSSQENNCRKLTISGQKRMESSKEKTSQEELEDLPSITSFLSFPNGQRMVKRLQKKCWMNLT